LGRHVAPVCLPIDGSQTLALQCLSQIGQSLPLPHSGRKWNVCCRPLHAVPKPETAFEEDIQPAWARAHFPCRTWSVLSGVLGGSAFECLRQANVGDNPTWAAINFSGSSLREKNSYRIEGMVST